MAACAPCSVLQALTALSHLDISAPSLMPVPATAPALLRQQGHAAELQPQQAAAAAAGAPEAHAPHAPLAAGAAAAAGASLAVEVLEGLLCLPSLRSICVSG